MDSEEDVKVVSQQVIEDGSPTLQASSQGKSQSQSHSQDHKGQDHKDSELELEPELLHTGGVLGDLPALTSPTKSSPNKYNDYTASGKNASHTMSIQFCIYQLHIHFFS